MIDKSFTKFGFMNSLVLPLLVQVLAFAIFTASFLNIKPPSTTRGAAQGPNIRIETEPLIDRLVFIVIDALRADFVYSESSPMQFTKQLIETGQATAFIAKAAAPTVTLPRLKALTAGTLPVFLDFLANLDESSGSHNQATHDSWLRQLFLAGKKMVFLGDDTWLRLFPKEYFIRTDPTTSFFVKVKILLTTL